MMYTLCTESKSSYSPSTSTSRSTDPQSIADMPPRRGREEAGPASAIVPWGCRGGGWRMGAKSMNTSTSGEIFRGCRRYHGRNDSGVEYSITLPPFWDGLASIILRYHNLEAGDMQMAHLRNETFNDKCTIVSFPFFVPLIPSVYF